MRGRPREPLAKAKATGAFEKHPERYKDRKEPKSRPIGKPSADMSKKQVALWHYFVREAGWLVETDRILLEIVCQLRAQMFSKAGLSGAEYGRLINALSKLGMTPVDRSRVLIADSDKQQSPAETFFN